MRVVVPHRGSHPLILPFRTYDPPADYDVYRETMPDLRRDLVVEFARLTLTLPGSVSLNAPTRRGGGELKVHAKPGGARAWTLRLGKRSIIITEGDLRRAMEALERRHGGTDLVREWRRCVVHQLQVVLKRFDDTTEVELYDYLSSLADSEHGQTEAGTKLLKTRSIRRWTLPLYRGQQPTDYGLAFARLLEIVILQQPEGGLLMPMARPQPLLEAA